MPKEYTTKQGDMWDSIAFSQLGDVAHTDKIMSMNRQHHEYYIFPAGIGIRLPEIEPGTAEGMPPWKQVTA